MGRVEHVQPGYVVRDSEIHHRPSLILARIVNLVGGVIISLLTLRFILALLGANRGNGITDFIYNASHPFVAPFFGMFNYTEQIGVVRFEVETLVAIAFYAIAMVILTSLLSLNRRLDEY